jgi:phosphatidylserine/phosphatidylglycerophosphate/cardiolipin synthase-like enzyme
MRKQSKWNSEGFHQIITRHPDNKVIIIDRSTVIIGSFNFTKAAEEQHAENVLIISGSRRLPQRTSRTLSSRWRIQSLMLVLNEVR